MLRNKSDHVQLQGNNLGLVNTDSCPYVRYLLGAFMPDVKEERGKSSDPFEPFRQMRDAYLDSMSKMMSETVNSESYAQTMGTMLDYYLTASAPFREVVEKSTLQALQQLSLPSRQEVAALAERFTTLEMRIDDLDAKLDRVVERTSPSAGEQRDAAIAERLSSVEAKLNDLIARFEQVQGLLNSRVAKSLDSDQSARTHPAQNHSRR